MSVTLNRARHPKLKRTLRSIARNWDLYLLLVPVLAYFIIFHYAPMYGVQIAFRRYSIRKGILGSQWVGMAHFNRFFQSYYFERLLVNTLTISLYNLALGFPLPWLRLSVIGALTYETPAAASAAATVFMVPERRRASATQSPRDSPAMSRLRCRK